MEEVIKMNEKLAEFIKKKVDKKVKKPAKTKADIISELGITTQYLHDLENGKRTPSPDLMKKMITTLSLNEKEQIQLLHTRKCCSLAKIQAAFPNKRHEQFHPDVNYCSKP